MFFYSFHIMQIFCFNCVQRSRLWAVAVCVRIAFQTEKMLGRATNQRIEHSPAIAYEPLLWVVFIYFFASLLKKFSNFSSPNSGAVISITIVVIKNSIEPYVFELVNVRTHQSANFLIQSGK